MYFLIELFKNCNCLRSWDNLLTRQHQEQPEQYHGVGYPFEQPFKKGDDDAPFKIPEVLQAA